MTRFSWLRMTRSEGVVRRNGSRNRKTHYLEHRIVFCADCDSRRALTFNSGSLACSSCGSGNWIHPPSNATPRLRQYSEAAVETTSGVQRTAGQLSKEAFFAPEGALV
jgi:hypothetical protein